jgi:hypothetical protein
VARQRSPDKIGVGADTACRDLMVEHGAKDQNPGSGIASAFPPWLRKSATDIDSVGGQRSAEAVAASVRDQCRPEKRPARRGNPTDQSPGKMCPPRPRSSNRPPR